MDLFDYMRENKQEKESPLASRMRPTTLDEVVGQQHIIGKDKLLYRAIKADKLGSIIFYGPPGTGKTTLAKVIANTTSAEFKQINATVAGKKDMEEVVKEAKDLLGMYGKKTILFIDEIHRFNKGQQDYLLPFVEDGTITLIGATTENPYFEVNGALLSRSSVFELHALEKEDIKLLLHRAVYDKTKGMGSYKADIDKDAIESIHLCDFPKVEEAWINKELEDDMEELLKIVVLGRAARNTANIKNRQPIGTMYVKADKEMGQFYTDIIADELNVKEVKFASDVESFVSYSFKPQLRTVGPKYGKLLNDIRTALAEINGTEAMNELKSTGLLTLDIDGNKVELSEEDLLIETAQTEGYVTEADGDISVVLDTNLTPELIEEGFVREIVSKVQTMRKEAGFEVMDKIHIYAKDNDKILELMKNHKEEIMSEVLAEDMTLGTTDGYVKEWNINKEPVVLGVAKM